MNGWVNEGATLLGNSLVLVQWKLNSTIVYYVECFSLKCFEILYFYKYIASRFGFFNVDSPLFFFFLFCFFSSLSSVSPQRWWSWALQLHQSRLWQSCHWSSRQRIFKSGHFDYSPPGGDKINGSFPPPPAHTTIGWKWMVQMNVVGISQDAEIIWQ